MSEVSASSSLSFPSLKTTKEPTERHRNSPDAGQSVNHLPERLSRRNRNRVLKLSSSYRNPMVKHEPEPHMRGGAFVAFAPMRGHRGPTVTGPYDPCPARSGPAD